MVWSSWMSAFLPSNKETDNEQVIAKRGNAKEGLECSYQTEILDSIQDDFFVLDRNWNYVYASKRYTARIGKEPKDFIGKNAWEMFPKHLGTIVEENFHATMEKKRNKAL
jgi:transcriptional regulator with PAS, ATPase and Fis domain